MSHVPGPSDRPVREGHGWRLSSGLLPMSSRFGLRRSTRQTLTRAPPPRTVARSSPPSSSPSIRMKVVSSTRCVRPTTSAVSICSASSVAARYGDRTSPRSSASSTSSISPAPSVPPSSALKTAITSTMVGSTVTIITPPNSPSAAAVAIPPS